LHVYIEYNAKEIFTNAFKSLVKAQHPAQKQLVILEYSPDEDKDKEEEEDERERESALKITFFCIIRRIHVRFYRSID